MSEDIISRPAFFRSGAQNETRRTLPDTKAGSQTREYQRCKRCIMDTSDPAIQFDENGVCNHCKLYARRAATELKHHEEGQKELAHLLNVIKAEGKGRRYDCIIGVSGGVDSTMVAYRCRQYGLRPLAVHLDNGWDSELAVSNIEKTLQKLDIDLYTHVVDWEEFKDIQLSFLKASVANAEIPSDHAIGAILYRIAAKENIRFVISGSNIETEAIMPTSWMYDNRDFRHLQAIHKKYGKKKIKTFPYYTLADFFYFILLKKIRLIRILNYAPYRKSDCMRILQEELGWVYYGGKHYESIFTRFFQGYYLPKKFGIDKRLAHLSTLICAGQITREKALEEMQQEPYPAELFHKDREFFVRKFHLTEAEFDSIMTAPPRRHEEFPSHAFIFQQNGFGLRELAKRLATRV